MSSLSSCVPGTGSPFQYCVPICVVQDDIQVFQDIQDSHLFAKFKPGLVPLSFAEKDQKWKEHPEQVF